MCQCGAQIAAAKVSVLIDYDGMHEFNNALTLHLDPAPVQLAYLGFAAPAGATSPYAFSVVDNAIAPPETAAVAFGEKLMYTAGSYQPQVRFAGNHANGRAGVAFATRCAVWRRWTAVCNPLRFPL